MTDISYTLQPGPFWYLADLTGRPASGGKMYTKSSLNPSQDKPVYQDPAGSTAYTNPVIFDANGMAGPFYWAIDADAPNDLYYLRFTDSNDNEIDSINVYPIAGGGGGGPITLVNNIENIITNSQLLHNCGSISGTPLRTQVIAPGAHSGLYMPDIQYVQSGVGSNANDSISFLPFAQGSTDLDPNSNPPFYLNYTCNNDPTGETSKIIQIPISQYVNTFQDQTLTFTFWAKYNSGAHTLNFTLVQYFGSGGSPTATNNFDLTQTKTLTNSWVLYTVNVPVPSTATTTLGNSNDDGTYIQIVLPTGLATNINIALPSLFYGIEYPDALYESVESTEAQLQTPRTGDVKVTASLFSNNASATSQLGWIPLNDGTIGNASSNATTRAASDTWLLYKLIWDNTTATNCPVYTNADLTTPTTKGGDAISDWNANKSISLPRTLGRVTASRGTANSVSSVYTVNASTDVLTLVTPNITYKTGDAIVLTTSGTVPAPLSANATYYAIRVTTSTLKLALSAEDAVAGNAVDITSTGTGTQTFTTPPPYALAGYQGESQHALTVNELASHTHAPTPGSRFLTATGGTTGTLGATSGSSANSVLTTAATGSNYPHNTMQPTVFYNMIIKL